jgi:hypothetical protein
MQTAEIFKSVSGFVTSIPAKAWQLSLTAKIVSAVIILAVIIAIYLYLRDSPLNNYRRAKKLHQKASGLHEKGDEEKAKALFEKANIYREKAYEEQHELK